MNTIKPVDNEQLLGAQKLDFKKNVDNKEQPSFKDTLVNMLDEVNDDQLKSNEMVQKFLNGEITDVHQVMIAAEKADISLQMTLALRNKILEIYRQVMRIQ